MINHDAIIFLKQDDIQALLNEDSMTIDNWSEHKILLSMNLSTGETLYPEFQFRNGNLFPELIVLSQKFPKETTGWEITCWFYKWNDNLRAYPYTLLDTKAGREAISLTIQTENLIKAL